MGKKKKLKKFAEYNIQILKSGKVKFMKNEKVDISSFVDKSVENTIISRLNGIISKEDVVIDTKDLHSNVSTSLTSQLHTVELTYKANNPDTETVVITMPKKSSLNLFDYLGADTLGEILRVSSLAAIYKQVKDKWVELNKNDTSQFTNVMFVPDVMIFLDSKGFMLKNPMNINVLIIAVPSRSKMNEGGIEEPTVEEAITRVVADVSDAAIKCGAKHLIIDPFDYKLFYKNPTEASKAWNQIVTTEKYIENNKSTIFAINSDELFVIFNANKITPDK